MTNELWKQFDRIIVFDTETTGINFSTDRIIELGAVALKKDGKVGEMNCLIHLPEGQSLPPFIVELTGITDGELARSGVLEDTAAQSFCHLLDGCEHPLLVAYNAQFDLNFMYRFLKRCDRAEILRCAQFLDALTVYRDRRDYPHKLCNAISTYGLEQEVRNSHRAVDDACATIRLLEEMAQEKNDLHCYINLFGTHPKYGVSGQKISSVTYRTQPYRRTVPLYEQK